MVNWTNVTDFGQLPAVANSATNGTFWGVMLHMLWLILILVMINYGFEVALLVASFLAMIIALILTYAGLVSWAMVMEFAGIILFMFLYIIWSGYKK